jgi:hypothetical protein
MSAASLASARGVATTLVLSAQQSRAKASMKTQDYNVVIDRRAPRIPGFAGWPRLDVRVTVRGEDEAPPGSIEKITEVLREAIDKEAQQSSAARMAWRRLSAVVQKARLGPLSSIQAYKDGEANLLISIASPRLKLDGPRPIPEPPDPDAQKVAKAVAAAGVSNACICAVVGGPGGIGYDLTPSTAVIGTPLPAGQTQYRAAIFVKDFLSFTTDAVRMEWPPGQTLPANQTEIVLRVGAPNFPHTWAKEVYGWTYCRLRTRGASHPGGGWPGEAVLPLTRAQCEAGDADTIVFAKPGFWGVWTDVFHWTPESFWGLHSGRRVTYTWLQ